MSKTVLLLTFVLTFSCNSQVISTKELKGNWYLLANSEIHNATYTEIFIDDNYIYYFTDRFGLKPKSKYEIRNNVLFQSGFDSKIEMYGELSLGDSIFLIKSDESKAVLKKIADSINLEGYIKNKVNEDIFKRSFMKRLEKWKE